jgi:class 3 adenylate cyclase/predicted ATPase
MICPKCNFTNSEDAKFCKGCGYKFELDCPSCSKTYCAGTLFCDECGYDLRKPENVPPTGYSEPRSYTPKFLADKILTTRAAIEGERKLVTVLFADVANYTALSEKLDPEEIHVIMDGCFKILMDEIHNYEGTINQFTGDGVMALFGAPITHEDHAVRALNAALEIQTSLKEYGKTIERKWGLPFQMRFGLNTGLVVVGRIGDNLRMDYTARGDTTNVAARLQQIAPVAAIFVGEATYRLVEKAFEWQERGPIEVKGKTEPILVYELIGCRPVKSRFEISTRKGLTPFVGRQSELSTLQKKLEKTRQGQGQAIEIVGEAGVGKSRLLYEFRQSMKPDVAYIEGQCVPYGGTSAYQPLIGILRQHWSLPDKITDQTQESFSKKLNGLRDYLPCFEDLLSLPISNPNYIQLSPYMRRNNTFEALIKLFQKIAKNKQLILAIEDVHWMDQTSQEFISAFLDRIEKHSIFVILLSRPEFQSPWKGHLSCAVLSLPLLPDSEESRLVQAMFDAPVAPELKKFIIERTEGNPFFAEELTLTLHETNALKRNGSYTLSISPDNLKIPETIQGVLAARIDNLDESIKNTLQIASVVGREFTIPLLRTVLGVNGTLEKQLDLLCNTGFVFPKPNDDSTFIFKHSLTRDVAYETLLRGRRRQLHQKIGDTIKELFPDVEQNQPEILAYHYTEAGLPHKAIPYWQQAGQKAIQRSANPEAISYLKKGLELINTQPEPSKWAQQELLLQSTLGAAFADAKGFGSPEVGETFNRARKICQQVGETSLLFPCLRGIYFYYLVRENLQATRDIGEQLLSLARKTQDTSLIIEAYHALGMTSFHMARFSTAHRLLKKVIDLYDLQQHSTHAYVYGFDPAVSCLGYYSFCLCQSGFFDRALAKVKESLNLAKQIGHQYSLAYAQTCCAIIFNCRGESQAAREYTEKSMGLCNEYGFPHWLAWNHVLHGWAIASQGDVEEGIEHIQSGLDIHRAIGSKISIPTELGILAEACLLGEQYKKGLDSVEEAFRDVHDRGEAWWRTELLRIKGELLLSHSEMNQSEAESLFNQAIGVAKKQETKYFELQATISLTKLFIKQDRITEAKNVLAKIYNWFTEGFDTRVLKEARNLLEELA